MSITQDLTLDPQLFESFLAGYLNARGQTDIAQAQCSRAGTTVRYGPGMGRSVEHFAIAAEALDPQALADGDWLTLFGAAPLPALPADVVLTSVAHECFMAVDLATLCAALDAAPGLDPRPETDRADAAAVVFRHRVDGADMARVTCALASAGDVVLDRLATEPAWRGRGLARSLMRAAADWAQAQGRRRMLLIASPEGELLYRRLAFDALAGVRVYSVATARS
jgi:GNAT superfamily N-acetyltransferase